MGGLLLKRNSTGCFLSMYLYKVRHKKAGLFGWSKGNKLLFISYVYDWQLCLVPNRKSKIDLIRKKIVL